MLKKWATLLAVPLAMLSMLSGCAPHQAMQLVNTMEFDLSAAPGIRMDYDADDILVLNGEPGKAIIKEYMNEDNKRYYARTRASGQELFISEGQRPLRPGFMSYVELYVPAEYKGGLNLHSTSGAIQSSSALRLGSEFLGDTTSGSINVANLEAARVSLKTTSGTVEGDAIHAAQSMHIVSTSGPVTLRDVVTDSLSITTTSAKTSLTNLAGNIGYTSTSGTLASTGISGHGSFEATGEGSIEMSFAAVNGDIKAYGKNGAIKVTLPADLSFHFSATTREGQVHTNFDGTRAVTTGTISRIIGDNPTVSVNLETRNGTIQVSR